MGDIYCAKCGEPWDAYGVNDGDMSWREAARFKRGEGCPACGFGTFCPTCGGVGRVETGCGTCFNSGRVYVRTTDKRPSWEFGYRPNVQKIDYEPFRETDGFQNDFEGWVYQGVALCPDCLHTDPERGQPCPACNGSGKLEIGEEEETAVWEKAVWSAMEESDEEPIGILARYVEQKGLGNV